MPLSGDRLLGLQNWIKRNETAFHKTVTVERLVYPVGTSPYRSGGDPTTEYSILIDPSPSVRLLSEEDISEGGANVSLGDYIFTMSGASIQEDKIRNATHLVLNKNLDDEEKMQILQIRPDGWTEQARTVQQLAIVQGKVIRWAVFARATKLAA
jgi:hypothetical protein